MCKDRHTLKVEMTAGLMLSSSQSLQYKGCKDATIILAKPKSVAINLGIKTSSPVSEEREMHYQRVNHVHCLRLLLQDELSTGIVCLYKVDLDGLT